MEKGVKPIDDIYYKISNNIFIANYDTAIKQRKKYDVETIIGCGEKPPHNSIIGVYGLKPVNILSSSNNKIRNALTHNKKICLCGPMALDCVVFFYLCIYYSQPKEYTDVLDRIIKFCFIRYPVTVITQPQYNLMSAIEEDFRKAK
jgi:hypothetical protein